MARVAINKAAADSITLPSAGTRNITTLLKLQQSDTTRGTPVTIDSTRRNRSQPTDLHPPCEGTGEVRMRRVCEAELFADNNKPRGHNTVERYGTYTPHPNPQSCPAATSTSHQGTRTPGARLWPRSDLPARYENETEHRFSFPRLLLMCMRRGARPRTALYLSPLTPLLVP